MNIPSFEGQNLSALAQLIAIHEANGTTSTAELAKLTGYTDRAIRKAKAELQFRNQDSARNPSAGTIVPDPEPECRPKRNQDSACKKEIPHTPKEKTTYHLEQPPERTTGHANTHALAGFVGKFVTVSADKLAEMVNDFPKLSFPGDLRAADAFFASKVHGIDFSSQDDRMSRIYPYLAKRNREAIEAAASKAAAAQQPQKQFKMGRYGPVEVRA